MSTRGSFIMRKDGVDKELCFPYDAYPDGGGRQVIRVVKTIDLDRLFGLFHPDDTSDEQDCERLLTMCENIVYRGEPFRYMRPSPPFIQDSLLCEYAYVVNLDEQTLEFYVGMQTEPQEGNRYGTEGRPCATGELFYPCRLLATYSLEQVRAEDTAALSDTMRRLTKEYRSVR